MGNPHEGCEETLGDAWCCRFQSRKFGKVQGAARGCGVYIPRWGNYLKVTSHGNWLVASGVFYSSSFFGII
jgi:hypothetical protein